MIFYTVDAFVAVFKRKASGMLYIRQEVCLFLIQFFAYATICLKTGKVDYLFFYAILQLVIFSAIVLNQTIYTGLDKGLLNNMALLLSFGFIILTRLDFSKSIKQLVIVAVSLTVGFFIPVIISSVVIGQLWQKIYNGDYGLLNSLLSMIGIQGQDWIGQESTALVSAFIPNLWQYIGYHMLIMYAGIKSISPDINEAARIDGASKTQIAFKITIPLLKPVLQVCATFSLIGALKIFDLIYVLTGGGPFFSTEVPTIYMYKTIFDSFKYGYGSAIAIFVIIECLILTGVLRLLFRDKEKA